MSQDLKQYINWIKKGKVVELYELRAINLCLKEEKAILEKRLKYINELIELIEGEPEKCAKHTTQEK